MRYTTLLIDADDTLLDFGSAEREAFMKTFEKLGKPSDEDLYRLYSAINLSLWKAFERGEIEKSAIPQRRFERLYEEAQISGDPREAASVYVETLTCQGQLIPGAREFLERVCETHDIYAVTNGIKSIQRGRFAKADIGRYFKGVFISEEVGVGKPDKRYFDYVLEHIDEKDPEKVLVIGDSLTSDVLGAVNAGLDSVWFNARGEKAREDILPTYTVTGYDRVFEII